MTQIEQIVVHDGFLEVIFKGASHKGFPDRDALLDQILAASEEHDCQRVMENLLEVDYAVASDVLAEHELAEYLTQPRFRAIKWAYLLPKTAPSTYTHVETAAVNRGVRLRAFLDRDEAIVWLLGD